MSYVPKVTIIMSTYNRAHFIVETLHSIQNQTYQNWECLIIDDGSTDNTLEVITPILEIDKRFQFLKRPDTYLKGLPGCRNYGLDIAQGKFIQFFDDDDMVHPDNLKLCLDVIENNQIDFCHYQKKSFTNNNPLFEINQIQEVRSKLSIRLIEDVVSQKIGLASCTVMWKRKCFNTHRFNESLQYAEEWELYTRIISEGFKGVVINNILYYNRKHPNSNTGEYYNNDPIRIASKKEAIRLVTQNLVQKQILSPSLLKHLVGNAISFRDIILLNDILSISNTSLKNKLYLKLKFHLFPIWKIYKRTHKKIT